MTTPVHGISRDMLLLLARRERDLPPEQRGGEYVFRKTHTAATIAFKGGGLNLTDRSIPATAANLRELEALGFLSISEGEHRGSLTMVVSSTAMDFLAEAERSPLARAGRAVLRAAGVSLREAWFTFIGLIVGALGMYFFGLKG